MGSIHIRICHNDDLVIAKLCNVKIIAVSFGKSTSKCIDHGLDLCVGKYLVNAGLLHIQDLSSDRQDCLVVPVSGCLCRTARRISLYDKNLTFFCIPALTVCQFPIAVKRIFLLCQKIRLRLFLRLSDLCSLLRTGQYFFQRLYVPVKIQNNLISGHFSGGFCCIRVVQLCLGLPFKPRIRMLDGNNRGHPVSDICSCKIRILLF